MALEDLQSQYGPFNKKGQSINEEIDLQTKNEH